MGCDIHLYIEKKINDGVWVPCHWESKYRNNDGDYDYNKLWEDPLCVGRNYDLFAILANVRNYGFSDPIDYPRGLPKDVSKYVNNKSKKYGIDGHSHSYYLLSEIMDNKHYFVDINYQRVSYFIDEFIPAALKEANTNDLTAVRIVFFFDS